MKNIFILLVALLATTACQQVMNIDLNSSSPKIVIQGYVTNDNTAYLVNVSYTSNYYTNQPPPPVNSALVVISDLTDNVVDTLSFVGNGTYVTNAIEGRIGHTYKLSVKADGEVYESTDRMGAVPPIDSLGIVFYEKTNPFHKDTGYYPKLYTVEPQATTDFYMWKFYKNGKLLNEPTRIFIGEDKFLQGKVDGWEFPYAYHPGDTAAIEMYAISRNAYNFYMTLQQQLNNDGGFFSAPPANSKGNISNGALGLFLVAAVTRDSIIIDKR